MYDQIPTIRWKFGENRSGGSWDHLSERFILKKETTECTPFTLNFGDAGPKFIKFLHDVARWTFQNQNGDIAIPFGMPGLRIKVNNSILPTLTIKLLAMATSLDRWKKGWVDNLRSNTYHVVKIWWKSVLYHFAQYLFFKEEINACRIYRLSPRGMHAARAKLV